MIRGKKIGASYNLFDGEELLEKSISSIRPFVDYIVIVVQDYSNFGETYEGGVKEANRLYQEGLVDYVIHYEPTLDYSGNQVFWESGHKNEITKRNVGLDHCRDAGMDYLLQMDCDEFYNSDQAIKAIEYIIDKNCDSSFCQMATYYKKPTYELFPKETYYVPFIAKIQDNTVYKLYMDYPVQVDNTRMTKFGNGVVFSRDELEMYHYSFVRKDIGRKFANSSSVFPKDEIENVKKRFDNFQLGEMALLLGNRVFEIKEVENQFNIEI